MDKRALMLFTAVLLAGMFLFGNGITGLYVMDFKQAPCDTDDKCVAEGTCCLFYKESFGICDKQENCKAIEQTTFDARRKISTYDSLTMNEKYEMFSMVGKHIEGPAKENKLYSAIAGIFLVLFAILGFFIGKVRDIHAGKSHSLYRTKRHKKK